MNWDRAISLLTLFVDMAILAVLILEFNYDKIQDERREYKRKKANEKKAAKDIREPIKGSYSTHMEPQPSTTRNP